MTYVLWTWIGVLGAGHMNLDFKIGFNIDTLKLIHILFNPSYTKKYQPQDNSLFPIGFRPLVFSHLSQPGLPTLNFGNLTYQ